MTLRHYVLDRATQIIIIVWPNLVTLKWISLKNSLLAKLIEFYESGSRVLTHKKWKHFEHFRSGFCQNRQDHDTYLQIEVYRVQGAEDTGEEDGESRLVGQAKLAIYPRGGEDSPRKEYR